MTSGYRVCSLLIGTAFFAFSAADATGQSSAEFFTSSVQSPAVGPTTAEQTARLLVNADNPSASGVSPANTNVTVRASLSNQQFAGVGTGKDSPVVMFGAAGKPASDEPRSLPTFDPLGQVGGGANGDFSGVIGGNPVGINTTANTGFRIFTSVRQFAEGKSAPTGQRFYLADLTLTFSSPVSDPYLHLSGLGARIGALTYSTELEPSTPGVSVVPITGTPAFAVSSANIGTVLSQFTTDRCDAQAGCGTVRIAGRNLTSLTFRVYIRGNGGTATWGSAADHNGDEWMLSLSLPSVYDLAGTVFYDPDGPATLDGWEFAEPDGRQLHVNLIDPTDMSVIGSSEVSDAGRYSFAGVPGSGTDHLLELSTEPGTELAPAPEHVLPFGWTNVGEQLRLALKTGNDGAHDGRLAVNVTSISYANALFAVKMESGSVADIRGRVTMPNGRSASKCVVELIDPIFGDRYAAHTNSFGYYRFIDVPAGRIYVVTATDRKRSLSQSVDQLVVADISGVDMVLQFSGVSAR